MLIRKHKDQEDHGIFFAVWPRQTSEGWVSCERLHWERIPSWGWGWGSGDTYRYSRLPDKWEDDGATFQARPPPPTMAKWHGLDTSALWNENGACGINVPGKTCTYPNCTCMNEHGGRP